MKLSSQEEYGLRCLLQIARAGEGASLTIAEVSEREGISAPNVAKIMRLLRRAELVRSTRGKAGGYTLSRPASEVQVLEVVTVLGGRLFDAEFCDRHAGLEVSCLNSTECSIRPVLHHLQAAVDRVLGEFTLQSLLANEQDVTDTLHPGAVPLPVLNQPS